MKTHPLVAGLTLALASTLCLTGCSTSAHEDDAQSSSTATTAQPSAYPATVMSCTEKLTFTEAPKRVLILGDTNAPTLSMLDLLDRVTMRTGKIDTTGYDVNTATKLMSLPEMKSGTTTLGGGASVATESILDAHIDLVIGYDEGLDRAALRKAGVKVYAPDTFCPHGTGTDHASFDLVTKEVSKVGDIFGVPDKARTLNDELTGQVKDLTSQASKDSQHSAAALWVEPGNSGFYTYGTSSMVQPILEANGLRNVYDGERKRVFDATMEDVLNRDPEWIVLLAQEGDIAKTKPAFLKYKGASQLQAVRKNQVVVIPFSLTDPPTPQSIKGAVELNKLLKK